MRRGWIVVVGILPLILFLASVPLNARVAIKPGFNTFSPQQDIQMGRQSAAQVERQARMVTDPQVTNYINRLGKKLAGFAPGYRFPYEFHVVESKQINAFALPGGNVYVHTATVLAATNEAQLAGVMSHEISHVALRHSTNQASKALLARVPLAVLGGVFAGGAEQLAQLGISFGLNSVFLKFSRGAESQADELGSQIMYDAGYDPRELARFFQTIEKQSGNETLDFLSDHPNPGNRVENVQRLIPKLGPAKSFDLNDTDFEQFKARVAQLQGRGSSRQGRPTSWTPPPDPSQRFLNLDANFLSIRYPDNWQVHGQDTGTVTIVPQQGIISGQGGDYPTIAYGAMSSIFETSQQSGRQSTLSAATDQLIAQLQQSNPHLHVVAGSSRTLRVDGQPAYSVTALGQSPIGSEAEMDWIVTTFRPEGLWYIVFVAPEQSWNLYSPAFQQMLNSIRFPR